MTIDLFVPLGAFVMITVSVALVTRLIATAILNKTIREAMRSDPGTVPLLADKLEQRQPWADALLGVLFLAFAVCIVGLAFFEYGEDRARMFKAAVIPTVLGVVTLLFVTMAGRHKRR